MSLSLADPLLELFIEGISGRSINTGPRIYYLLNALTYFELLLCARLPLSGQVAYCPAGLSRVEERKCT
jgi:hypothetical protein